MLTAADGVLDLVITNALIIDAVAGVMKADIGIKDGRIAGIGKAGDPRIMNGVSPNMIVGVNTDVRAAEGLIVTAGGIDCHVHFIDPGQCQEALSAGVTTLMGGGLGPTTVPIASTGTVNLGLMLQAIRSLSSEFWLLRQGGVRHRRAIARTARGRRGGSQDPRRLGRDDRSHRQCP